MDHEKNITKFLSGIFAPSAKASPFPDEFPTVEHVRAFRPLNNTRDAQLKKAAEQFSDLPFEANATFINEFVAEFRSQHHETGETPPRAEFLGGSHPAQAAEEQ